MRGGSSVNVQMQLFSRDCSLEQLLLYACHAYSYPDENLFIRPDPFVQISLIGVPSREPATPFYSEYFFVNVETRESGGF